MADKKKTTAAPKEGAAVITEENKAADATPVNDADPVNVGSEGVDGLLKEKDNHITYLEDVNEGLKEINARLLEKLQQYEAPAPEPEAPEEELEPFELNGKRYGFTKRAPKKLSVNGQFYTQKELLTNTEEMESLIAGGSSFVKQL